MKPKTIKAADSIRNGFLSFPHEDLVELFEWLFERSVDNGYNDDFEIELRESLGYQWEASEATGWAARDGKSLAELIAHQPIRVFAHGAGSLPFYAGLLDASPLDNPKVLEEEHRFGALLMHAAQLSEHPFIIVKSRFQALA